MIKLAYSILSIFLIASCAMGQPGWSTTSKKAIKYVERGLEEERGINMNKVAIIVGVLLTTSCGTFSKITEKEKEVNYQIDKAYFEYTVIRDSLILKYRYDK